MYIKSKERILYQFASNTKPLDTLTHWNLGFTSVTSALEYVCQTREYSSTIAKFVVSATVFFINNSLPMNKQNTIRRIYISLFCYGKSNAKQVT